MPESDLRVVPASEAIWEDLQTVFGRGAAAKCQCQRIKVGEGAWFAMPVDERAHRLRQETDCGNPGADETSGMVAYLDGKPVGWVAVEPRARYRRLRGSPVPWAGRSDDPDDPDLWAITCFAIRPGYRGQGLTRPLALAAGLRDVSRPTTRRVVMRIELK
jgi:GNAT superfamily N-acetyltransferase